MKWLLLAVGAALILLGGLWLKQGVGLVEIKPILCVADCETVTGRSATWAVVGAIAAVVGAAVLNVAVARFRRPAPRS